MALTVSSYIPLYTFKVETVSYILRITILANFKLVSLHQVVPYGYTKSGP